MLLIAALCSITIFPRFGTYVPSPPLHGPGLVLDGASAEPAGSITWIHRRLFGNDSRRAGNVVELRAAYTNEDDRDFYREGNFASVQTVLIPPCAQPHDVDAIARIVDGADAVYFAGGDQADYVPWRTTALMAAVRRVYARGGVVGGGSAGLAIQGAIVYDSVAADKLGVETHTADAVMDPLEPRISFTTGLFAWPALADTITDSHLVVRDRIGRTIAFLARILQDRTVAAATVYGLGIDQDSAVAVDPDGMATLFRGTGKGAYLIRASAPPRLSPGRPLRYTVELVHIGIDGERFDLLHRRANEPWRTVTVDGTRKPVYSVDPYSP